MIYRCLKKPPVIRTRPLVSSNHVPPCSTSRSGYSAQQPPSPPHRVHRGFDEVCASASPHASHRGTTGTVRARGAGTVGGKHGWPPGRMANGTQSPYPYQVRGGYIVHIFLSSEGQ